ncbi:MAG: DUF5916 domain-containing protein [Acidobacteriota bacterium]
MASRFSTLMAMLCVAFLGISSSRAQSSPTPSPSPAPSPTPTTITIHHSTAAITIDGDLSDAGWKDATRVDTWYETNPGDNTTPKMKNIAWLTYDDRALYAAFDFPDPDVKKIRAPFADRDNIPSSIDYGGIILDPRNDRRTGILFLANPRGIQYDSVNDDTTQNEDNSPDYFWESAAKITSTGWTLEIRIPFSSLRYDKTDVQTWGIMLYRNFPRDRRYQMFSNRLPRGSNCFICNESELVGLQGLPGGGHLVAAPYVSARQESIPRDGDGSSLESGSVEGQLGADVKWTPNADTAIDGTINPDFSQVESDVAAISANQRFAIFFPEKRPFFLEGIELFSTPIQAVYTRTITAPRWGVRATGKIGSNGYTVLVTDDKGGGSVILPGPQGSDFADQDFKMLDFIGRVRHDLGKSFVSFLVTDREIAGGGSNRLFGPDFQWRPNDHDTITGEFLYSESTTPDRPDLTAEWNGQKLSGHAADVWWQHSTRTVDWYTEFRDFGDEFRADQGFVPQVGYRENYSEAGYTFRPKGFFNRIRLFVDTDYTGASDGALLFRELSAGTGMDGKYGLFLRLRYANDRVRSGDDVLERNQLLYNIQLSPSRVFSSFTASGWIGQDIDFANSRLGRGANVVLGTTIRPSDHLTLQLNNSGSWLNVGSDGERLFLAQVQRLKATYTFNARMFVRFISQYVRTDREQALYTDDVRKVSGGLSTSALFAYKVNWQTVLFLGIGDDRSISETDRLLAADRQLFMKISYAFQR